MVHIYILFISTSLVFFLSFGLPRIYIPPISSHTTYNTPHISKLINVDIQICSPCPRRATGKLESYTKNFARLQHSEGDETVNILVIEHLQKAGVVKFWEDDPQNAKTIVNIGMDVMHDKLKCGIWALLTSAKILEFWPKFLGFKSIWSTIKLRKFL